MSIISTIGMMLLVLVGSVLVCLVAQWLEKNFPTEKYDERQQLARGRGYRLAFWVGFLYLLAAIPMMISQVEGEKKVEPYLLIFGGFALQNLVFHVYCLLSHAELPLSQKPLFTILGFLLLGVLWLGSFYNAQQRYPLTLVGYGSDGWTYMMVSFTFFAMALLHLIQLLQREKE